MIYDYTVIQVVCWVELPKQRRLCPIFCGNMDPYKLDTTMWYRVTRNPQEFHRLTGCQRDPRIWGVTLNATYLSANLIFHSRMNHFAIDYHFVPGLVQ